MARPSYTQAPFHTTPASHRPPPARGVPPQAEAYPRGVRSADERRRWDLCLAVARRTHSGEQTSDQLTGAQQIFHEARALYLSDLPTGEPDDPPAASRTLPDH